MILYFLYTYFPFVILIIIILRCILTHTINLARTVLRQSAYIIKYVCCSNICIIYSIYILLIKITFIGN